MKVGIIGAGVAGLAAAYDLINEGHEIIIFERLPFIGGQATTIPVENTRLEAFYHHLFTSDTAFTDFMNELGLGHQMMWLPSKNSYYQNGKIYPSQGAFDLLFRFTFLSFFERFRLGVAVYYLQTRKNWRKYEKVRAADWLARALGKHAYEMTLGAQLRGKFGPYIDEVSLVWMWCKFRLRIGSRKSLLAKEVLGYPRGSFQSVFDAAADYVRLKGGKIHLKRAVDQIITETAPDGTMKATGLISQGETFHFDRILATVPSFVLPRLVPDLPEAYLKLLNHLKYEAALVVILKMKKSLSNTYWLNISDPSFPFVAVIEQTNFIPPETYNGKHIVYISNYLRTTDRIYRLTDEEVLAEYIPYLKKINPDFSSDWIEQKWVFREESAQPIITLDYSKGIPSHRTAIENLYLANTTQVYPEDRGTNYSIRMGRQLAGMMIEDNRTGEWAHNPDYVASPEEYELTDFAHFGKKKEAPEAGKEVKPVEAPLAVRVTETARKYRTPIVAGGTGIALFGAGLVAFLAWRSKRSSKSKRDYTDPNDLPD